jgi:WD40 repeat protein
VMEFHTPPAGTTAKAVLRTYVGHTAGVTALGYSPDGKRMVSGAADGRVKVWDTETGVEALGLTVGSRDTVEAVGFSPDGLTLVATPRERPPVVYDGRPRYEAYKPQKATR